MSVTPNDFEDVYYQRRGAKVAGVYTGHFYTGIEDTHLLNTMATMNGFQLGAKEFKTLCVFWPMEISMGEGRTLADGGLLANGGVVSNKKVPPFVCLENKIYMFDRQSEFSGELFYYVDTSSVGADYCLELLSSKHRLAKTIGNVLVKPSSNLDLIYKVFSAGDKHYIVDSPHMEDRGLMKSVTGLNRPFEDFVVTESDV